MSLWIFPVVAQALTVEDFYKIAEERFVGQNGPEFIKCCDSVIEKTENDSTMRSAAMANRGLAWGRLGDNAKLKQDAIESIKINNTISSGYHALGILFQSRRLCPGSA